jgi:beta-lactamase regulating signal transducer with metallopeptidase domain
MESLKRKINFTFYQIITLGLMFMAFFFYLVILLYDRLRLVSASFLGKLETICGCPNHFTFLNHPYLFMSLLIAGLGIATFVGFITYKIIKLKKTTNNFVKNCLENKKNTLSPRLKVVAESLHLENRIVEINDKRLLVFCYGYINPRICISSAFVKKLNSTELKAVLLHEQHHLAVYDPSRIFIINIITKALFIVPGFKLLAKKYFVLSEMAADRWAIKNSSGKTPLAQAVYKILNWKEKMAVSNLSLPFFSVTEERVNKLIDDNYTIKIKFTSPKFIISSVFLLSFILFISLFINSTNTAIANHDSGACFAENNTECEMIDNNTECEMENSVIETAENYACSIIDHTK